MEGRRYADEPEPTWYSGQKPYEPPSPYESGVHERPSGAFRLPDQRSAESYTPPAPDPLTSSGVHAFPPVDQTGTPVRREEYPTIRPPGATSLADAPSLLATAYAAPASPAPSRRPGSGAPAATDDPTSTAPARRRPGSLPDSVYRTRRPISAAAVATLAALLMVPVVRLLIQVTFADDPTARGIVPAVQLALGLPVAAVGLYALTARGGASDRDGWLRPPIAYLPVGLIILLAAGLAVA